MPQIIEPLRITSPDGKEFLEALSEGTREVYEPALGVFLVFYKKEYGANLTLTHFLDDLEKDLQRPRRERKRVGRNVLRGFVMWMKEQGFKPKTIRTYVTSVQSLAAYYDYHLSARYVNLPTSQPASKKYPWTVDEVAEFVLMLPPQLQSIAVSTFQSGLGPADLLDVTYGDIEREYEQGIVPLCLDFARKKTDVPFMTFLGGWSCSLLKESLSQRGKLKVSDRIFWIPHRTISYHFREAGKRWMKGHVGGLNPCRLYSLRSAFRTLLSDEKVDPEYIEFWMGHRAPEQRRVYISKSREGWRKTYASYEYALTPSKLKRGMESEVR